MGLRMTDTAIWDEDWFIDLPIDYKLLYMYIKDRCDHAGIWKPNLLIFKTILGNNHMVFKDDFIRAVNKDSEGNEKKRIIILPNKNWFLVKFITFQLGNKYNPKIGAHRGALKILIKNKIKLEDIPDFDWSELQNSDNQQYTIHGVPNPKHGVDMGSGTLIERERERERERRIKEDENLKISQNGNGSWNQYPKYDADIPPLNETQIAGLREILKITRGVTITPEQIMALWSAFKTMLTGEKYYPTAGDVQDHFRNWIKKQDFKSEEFTKLLSGNLQVQPKIRL